MSTIEKPRQTKQETGGKSGISRREFLKALGVGVASVLCWDIEKAIAQYEENAPMRYGKDHWFFTPEEMKKVYEEEYNGEKILKNRFYKKENEWFATHEGKEINIPQAFIDRTLSHFKEMLERKAVRFFFRLDAFHSHLFVPEEERAKYGPLSTLESLQLAIKDENLGALYHNSEHLKPDADLESIQIHSKRNVIGWYNGRPIEILSLPTKTKSTAESTPGQDIGSELKFAANKDGEFPIKTSDDKEIYLDFSFDDNSYF